MSLPLEERVKRARTAIGALTKTCYKLRQELIASRACTHSDVSDFPWESDNGYGRQSRMTGRRCDLCGAVDRWGRGKFEYPEED